jgi:hypothetical protein
VKEPAGIGRDVLSVIVLLTATIGIAAIVIAIAYINPDWLLIPGRKLLEHFGLHELAKLLRKLI